MRLGLPGHHSERMGEPATKKPQCGNAELRFCYFNRGRIGQVSMNRICHTLKCDILFLQRPERDEAAAILLDHAGLIEVVSADHCEHVMCDDSEKDALRRNLRVKELSLVSGQLDETELLNDGLPFAPMPAGFVAAPLTLPLCVQHRQDGIEGLSSRLSDGNWNALPLAFCGWSADWLVRQTWASAA